VPEAYGGAGADALATVLVIEEVAGADVSASLIAAVNKLGSLPARSTRWESATRRPGHTLVRDLLQLCRLPTTS